MFTASRFARDVFPLSAQSLEVDVTFATTVKECRHPCKLQCRNDVTVIVRAPSTKDCAGCCLFGFSSSHHSRKTIFLKEIWVDSALRTETEHINLVILVDFSFFVCVVEYDFFGVSLGWPGRQSEARRFGPG